MKSIKKGIKMHLECPMCGKKNHVERKSIVECYGFEYSCTCGYFVYISDYKESDAFKAFNDEIIRVRQEKLMPKCAGCSE